jgi:hypothetical protein
MLQTRAICRALALSAGVLGLLAFMASAASAETGAHIWVVNGSGEKVELSVSGGAELETTGVLLTEILKIKVAFSCTAGSAIGLKTEANGTIGKGTKIKLSGCTTKLNGTLSSACEPRSQGEAGVILTNAGHGLVVLHKLESGISDQLFSVLPDEGETAAVIEMGPSCPLGTKVPVIGKGTLKDCEGLFSVNLVKHLAEEGPLTELWVISKTTEHKAVIEGSAWVFLTGEHAGLKFSGEAS